MCLRQSKQQLGARLEKQRLEFERELEEKSNEQSELKSSVAKKVCCRPVNSDQRDNDQHSQYNLLVAVNVINAIRV